MKKKRSTIICCVPGGRCDPIIQRTKTSLLLLVRKYLLVLGGAVLVAAPVSYLAIQKYMEGFAHRTSLSAWIYVLTVVLVLLITLATLFWQVRKAAGIEPAEIMKYE